MPPLDHDEKIVQVVRRHWWVLFSECVFIPVLAAVPIFSYEAVLIFLERWQIAVENHIALFFLFYSLWLLLLWVSFFLIWTNYYLDTWIVTNKRMIDIEQKGLFHREVSTFRLDRIQDITIETKGILATFFKFGDVIVETAGEHTPFLIRDAAHPEKVKEIIFGEYRAAVESHR